MHLSLKFLNIFLVLFFYCQNIYANREEPSSPQTIKAAESESKISMDFVSQLIDEGNYSDARSLLLDTINNSKNDEHAYNLLGYVERQLQNFSSSIEYYKTSLKKAYYELPTVKELRS